MNLKEADVLITGAGGMLGSALVPAFRRACRDVCSTDKVWGEGARVDVTVERDVRLAFDVYQPSLVVHMAAETDLEVCQGSKLGAELVNAEATRTVARLCGRRGVPVVYVSTAGVFDGEMGSYTEEDSPRPLNVYGRTKLKGEEYVRDLCLNKHLIVRAGWMMGGGPEKDHKFVGKVMQQIGGGAKAIHAVSDRRGTPTHAPSFAANLLALLEADVPPGTYHMTCLGGCSRFDVAREMVAILGLEDRVEVVPVESGYFKEYPTPRPACEVLRNAALDRLGLNLMPTWQSSLREYLRSWGTK